MSYANRNYYKKGSWNALCDVCGFKFKSDQMRKRWDGLMVCDKDWEPDHPQKYLRVREDRQTVPWVRTIGQDGSVFVSIPLVVDFTANVNTGYTPLTVLFSDLTRPTPLETWAWDFGDTVTSTSQNPSHVYVTPGTYTVTLTVVNPDDVSGTTVKASYITVTTPPMVANFTQDTTSGVTPLTVHFTDLSQIYPNSWNWDFGDGGTSTDQNPIYTYTTAGVYTVTCVVSNGWNTDTVTKSNLISINVPSCPLGATWANADMSALNAAITTHYDVAMAPGLAIFATRATIAGTPKAYIAYSTDNGATWLEAAQISNSGASDIGIAYGGGTFFHLSGTAQGEVSTDGTTWDDVGLSGQGVTIGGVYKSGVSYANGAFWGVLSGGKIYRSPTGTIWTLKITGGPTFGSHVVWTGSNYVVMGGPTTSPYYSTDGGSTWTEGSGGANQLTAVGPLVSDGNGTVVAADAGNGGNILYSTDHGVTWTVLSLSSLYVGTRTMNSIIYAQGYFTILTDSRTVTLHSADGINWTALASSRDFPANGTAQPGKIATDDAGNYIVCSNSDQGRTGTWYGSCL